LRERRETVVREHMESENHHDFDTTIDTFAPRAEMSPPARCMTASGKVRRYYEETRAAFPDQRTS